MRHVKNAVVLALVVLTMSLSVFAQTARLTTDNRNIAPSVGTGGNPGGPTGLFTVYDAQTLRAGEFTFSAAYSNFDRDPGNVDIVEIPVSFQIGINDYLEAFFTTDAYRAIKVNSPRNLSGFSLPNSRVRVNGVFTSAPAIILAPRGTGTPTVTGTVFRPSGTPFVQFPFVGGSLGNFGVFGTSAGPVFGFPTGFPTIGAPVAGGNGADLFPGLGSPVGGILPGLVLQTGTLATGQQVPTVATIAPSYLPDAPFLNRTYGESAFSTFNAGVKFRMTSPTNPFGLAVVPFVRFYADKPDDFTGFNQLQRGASPGGDRFDVGVVGVADARVASYANISANIGFTYNSSVKGEFASGEFTLLDRGNELTGGLAADFPINRYFQPIAEIRTTKYVGGRTPNAFEQDPIDLLGGVRIFPTRYFGMSFAYRYNANQQDEDVFSDSAFRTTVVNSATGQTIATNSTGVPSGFTLSDDPHGFIVQGFIGRRNARVEPTKPNTPAVINSVNISDTEIVLPTCPPGQNPRAGSSCNDSTSVSVTTNATDADGDQLLYQYTVSGGQVTGTGPNVTWDLSNAQPGTYTISVGVDDGCGVCGQPTTREVRVVNCTDCEAPPPPVVPCPTGLRVTANPELVAPGGTVTFTADVNLNGTNPTFNWTLSDGTIVSGQGTTSITVTAPSVAGTSFTATADLGNVDPSCRASASATAQTNQAPATPILVDEYGVEPADRSKTKLDEFARQLQADPNARAFVIGYGGTRGGDREAQRRITFAVNYLTRERGIDASRIVTVNGGTSSTGAARTQLYLVPAGATEPTPN